MTEEDFYSVLTRLSVIEEALGIRPNPVETPNVRQNTPTINQLVEDIIAEETNRSTDGDVHALIAHLKAQYNKEKSPHSSATE